MIQQLQKLINILFNFLEYKIMKKNVLKFMLLCVICTLFFTVKSCKKPEFSQKGVEEEQLQQPLTRSEGLAWDYPVKPGMETWKLFQSNEEMVHACQIPEEIISSLSTEELTDLCLQYPLLYDVFAFNSLNDGLDKLFSDFNGIRELNKRDDASNILINRYNEKVQSFSFLDGTAQEIGKGVFVISVSALEVLLSRVEIQDKQKEILQSLVAGYEAKFRYVDYFKGFGFKTNLYSRAHVILKIDKSSLDAENSVLFSGMGDEQSVTLIDRLSYQLIN